MNFEEALRLLKNEGDKSEYIYSQAEIREKMIYPEGSSCFLCKEDMVWEVGYTSNERGVNNKKVEEVYTTKEEGLRGFILYRLQILCGSNIIKPAKQETRIRELRGTDKLTLDVLIESMNKLSIPISYYYRTETDRHSVWIREEEGGWISEYVDYEGNILRKLNPMRLDRCISFSFSRILYLWYLDYVSTKYFDVNKSYHYFTTEEIGKFIV